MSYELLILRRAQKELAGLPKVDYQRVRDAISSLADNPRPAGCKKLKGREGWRIRSGEYRALYEIDDTQRKTWFFISRIVEMFIHRRSSYLTRYRISHSCGLPR